MWLLGALLALQTDSITVRVRVADTANVPVAGAEVSVVQGLNDARASGITDARGSKMLRIARTSDAIEIVARRIGYQRASTFLTPRSDTVAVSLTLTRATQTLAPVRVTEREDVKRKAYHADADEIEHSKRLIMDGYDVLTKMKPDILNGRAPGCGVAYVWVNGKWIWDAPPNVIAEMRAGQAASRTPHNRASLPMGAPSRPRGVASVVDILSSIKAEHIAEMNYLDCFDTSMPGLHASSALYVVLKTGIGYDPKIGSYVLDDKPKAAPARPIGYRNRLLGVFDAQTGDALAGVAVTDSASRTSALTTQTGTVSLLFLPEGPSTLRLHHDGYADTTITLTISPSDTLPVTLLLSPRK
jgi:hypothetical protein